jgi:hypothetical protein
MIYQQVNFNQFCDSFSDTYKNNFTYEGKEVLYEYLENYSIDTDENIELDTIALCCEYTQYDNLEELQTNYTDIKSIEELEDKTQVIHIKDSDSFIIADF